MKRKSCIPKIDDDIVTFESDANWVISSSKYGDKKRINLWISVYLENINNCIYEDIEENYKQFERLEASVHFLNGEYQNIVWIMYNSNLVHNDNVAEELKEMIVKSAIETAKKYI